MLYSQKYDLKEKTASNVLILIKMYFIHQFLNSIDSKKVYDLLSSEDGMSCEPTNKWLPLSPTKGKVSGLRRFVLKYWPLGKRRQIFRGNVFWPLILIVRKREPFKCLLVKLCEKN
jgi:hypothetical protein